MNDRTLVVLPQKKKIGVLNCVDCALVLYFKF